MRVRRPKQMNLCEAVMYRQHTFMWISRSAHRRIKIAQAWAEVNIRFTVTYATSGNRLNFHSFIYSGTDGSRRNHSTPYQICTNAVNGKLFIMTLSLKFLTTQAWALYPEHRYQGSVHVAVSLVRCNDYDPVVATTSSRY